MVLAESMLRIPIYFLWVATWLGSMGLIAYILKKKLNRDYPIFFLFVVAECATDTLNFCLSFGSYPAYYYIYWIGTAITTVLGFAVLHEVFSVVFRPYEGLRSFGSNLFRWSTVVLLMIGAVMALSSPSVIENPVTNFIFTIDRSVRLMQCGLVVFLYLFGRQLGLTDSHRVFGISIGFGVTAGVHLSVVTLRSMFTSDLSVYLLNGMNQIAFLAAVVVWTVYMYRREPERRRASVLDQPESWNYALAAATNKSGAAFLPNVVDTVEKVLTKRATHITNEFKHR